jgi:hypothetical protein
MNFIELQSSYLCSRLDTQFRLCATAFAEQEESGNCVDEEDDWSLKGQSRCSVCRLKLRLSKTKSKALHFTCGVHLCITLEFMLLSQLVEQTEQALISAIFSRCTVEPWGAINDSLGRRGFFHI